MVKFDETPATSTNVFLLPHLLQSTTQKGPMKKLV